MISGHNCKQLCNSPTEGERGCTPLAKYALEIIPEPFRSETLKNGMIMLV